MGFSLDPTAPPAFLLDWEVTKKCNLDCSYCPSTGPTANHDNSTKHPPLAECLETIDFMYAYVDLYMQYKRESQRKVVLNVYGGESLHHPNIVEILVASREKYLKYADNWHLTITCTTNGVVGKEKLAKITPLIDEFTVSFHAEASKTQQQQFFESLTIIKESNARLKAIIMMHNQDLLWDNCQAALEFCQHNNIKAIPKMFDCVGDKWRYDIKKIEFVSNTWSNHSNQKGKDLLSKTIEVLSESQSPVSYIEKGRACCGGRKLSVNNDLKSCMGFVPKQGFRGWYCSVNWFFLFVRQLDRKVFVNKDCGMSFSGHPAPLGTLEEPEKMIKQLGLWLGSKTMPVIQCDKDLCFCGFCAPKSDNRADFDELIFRHVIDPVFNKT